jgi:hypothetical protein
MANVADGRTVATRRAMIGQLSVGPKSKSPLEVSIMAHIGTREYAEGLLGMNFLAEFPHVIDVKAKVIKWL